MKVVVTDKYASFLKCNINYRCKKVYITGLLWESGGSDLQTLWLKKKVLWHFLPFSIFQNLIIKDWSCEEFYAQSLRHVFVNQLVLKYNGRTYTVQHALLNAHDLIYYIMNEHNLEWCLHFCAKLEAGSIRLACFIFRQNICRIACMAQCAWLHNKYIRPPVRQVKFYALDNLEWCLHFFAKLGAHLCRPACFEMQWQNIHSTACTAQCASPNLLHHEWALDNLEWCLHFGAKLEACRRRLACLKIQWHNIYSTACMAQCAWGNVIHHASS